jgi:hypothetical protein
MFAALRSYFRPSGDPAGPASRRRWDRTLRLFAFEFVVVVAGVLAAQGLQSWAAERSQRSSGELLLTGARQNVQSFGSSLAFWTSSGPCLRAHVRRIAAVASSGGTLTQREIGRPALPAVPVTSWTEEGRERALRVVSAIEFARYIGVNATAQNVNEAEQEIGREWAALRLIDPALGAPLAEDRSRVRQAAAAIDSRIGYILYTREQTGRLAAQLGIEMPRSASPRVTALIDRCGLIKDWR